MSTEPLSGRDLAAFVAACEARSVQGAADALHLTQSAVSKRLQALERAVGWELLRRGPHGVVPTKAGDVLYPEAKQALDSLRRAGLCLQAEAAAPELRLAASHTIGEFVLPGLLSGFREEGRRVHGVVEIINSPGVLHAVQSGLADVGFVEGVDPLDGLETLVLQRDVLLVVVAPSHRWAKASEIPATALPTEPYFARESGSGTRAVASQRLGEVGIELDPVLELASTESLKRSVYESGFTFLSELAVEEEVRAGALAAAPVGGVDLSRPLRAVRRPCARGRPVVGSWWRWLREGADRSGGCDDSLR